ncbi:MAG: hypothetical protein WD000_02390 [Thermodesulfobacteriota bacterium]
MPFFEVEIQNRVVTGRFFPKRIRGRQGNWHIEKLCYLAYSEQQVEEFATNEVKKRRILGVPRNSKRKLYRQVEALNIRRLA